MFFVCFVFGIWGKVKIKVKVTSLEMICTSNTDYDVLMSASNKNVIWPLFFMLKTKNNHDDYNNTESFTIPHFYIKHTNHPLNRVVHENKTKK